MDAVQLRELLTDQHPDLADLELREVIGGWGNQMWRLGDDLAVRIPREHGAPEQLRKEHRLLPGLAGRLPLPIPRPVRLSEPSARFPNPWLITTWVPGEPADRTPITSKESADVLATFLRALHVEAPADVPDSERDNPWRGEPMVFDQLSDHTDRPDEIRALWEDALAAPRWDGPRLWLHGDLHPANVIVADGTLSGVVDFEDLYGGDPSNDLAAAWILLPDGAAGRFFEQYPADEATIRRAKGWAVIRAMFLIAMGINGELGRPGGKPAWGPLGRAALRRLTH